MPAVHRRIPEKVIRALPIFLPSILSFFNFLNNLFVFALSEFLAIALMIGQGFHSLTYRSQTLKKLKSFPEVNHFAKKTEFIFAIFPDAAVLLAGLFAVHRTLLQDYLLPPGSEGIEQQQNGHSVQHLRHHRHRLDPL